MHHFESSLVTQVVRMDGEAGLLAMAGAGNHRIVGLFTVACRYFLGVDVELGEKSTVGHCSRYPT